MRVAAAPPKINQGPLLRADYCEAHLQRHSFVSYRDIPGPRQAICWQVNNRHELVAAPHVKVHVLDTGRAPQSTTPLTIPWEESAVSAVDEPPIPDELFYMHVNEDCSQWPVRQDTSLRGYPSMHLRGDGLGA